jgi:hypothetical protein
MLMTGLLGAWAGMCQATTLGYSGQLDLIETNTGAGRYAGASVGQPFSGVLAYGVLADATTDPLFPGDYDFPTPPFGGSITDGTTQTTGTPGEIVQVSVSDDQIIDAADLLRVPQSGSGPGVPVRTSAMPRGDFCAIFQSGTY